MIERNKVMEASRMICSSNWMLGFTGAGISAESGISTFRDLDGLWNRYPEGASGGIMGILRRHPETAHELFSGMLNSIRNAARIRAIMPFPNLRKWGTLSRLLRRMLTTFIKTQEAQRCWNFTVMRLDSNVLNVLKKSTFHVMTYFILLTTYYRRWIIFPLNGSCRVCLPANAEGI